MYRPMFSASHSAQLERRDSDAEHPALVRWNHQIGVPRVFGDIWASYADLAKEDSAYGTSQESDDEDTTMTAQEHDEQLQSQPLHRNEREETRRAKLDHSDSHGRTISEHRIGESFVTLVPPRPLVMANKTRSWVSLWYGYPGERNEGTLT